MKNQYKPTLAVHFVWNCTDNETVEPILDNIRATFARDVDKPFSRGLNIPLFFYSSLSHNMPPANSLLDAGDKNVVFIFCSVNTAGCKEWPNYIRSLPLSSHFKYVPLAIDEFGLRQSRTGPLKYINFIRFIDFPKKAKHEYAVMNIAHEIYRHGMIEPDDSAPGASHSIKLFLSHAKQGDTGRIIAEEIKAFIDKTNFSSFFDATEISPGYKFNEEIHKHIDNSTLIAIESDLYSSRYWCQREILYAKEKEIPIIVVNCLEAYEDRIFPAVSNVPCVHVNPKDKFADHDILQILITAILETLRFIHAIKSLKKYKKLVWIDEQSEISPRPPEIQQIIRLKEDGKSKICYPEPPIYSEEAAWMKNLSITAYTPLWKSEDAESLKDKSIGISISDFDTKGFYNFHMHGDQLKRLSQDLARHLLARSAKLIYGGDLRKDGFTQFILDEAIALKSRLNSEDIQVYNYLAWPLYITSKEILEWRANYGEIIETVECDIPADIVASVNKDVFLKPDSVENKYIWSRTLTEMRECSIKRSDARICAGGKLTGYNGKMPGILEEIHLAIKLKKPLFLLGGFGGVVSAVCCTIDTKKLQPPLTKEWQEENNSSYSDLQKYAASLGYPADYDEINNLLVELDIDELARRAKLETDEYKKLMRSPFIEECLHLIIKGLMT